MIPPPQWSTLFPYTTLFRSFDEKEAAEQIGCTFHTLRKWRLLGKGPRYHKVGRLVRYAEADLSAYLDRSEEHTSELQSHVNLVCRLLLEKKNTDRRL